MIKYFSNELNSAFSVNLISLYYSDRYKIKTNKTLLYFLTQNIYILLHTLTQIIHKTKLTI